jgi:hypothetical protein
MQKLLEDLVQKGDILSYNLVDLDENGNPGRSRSGNTERLTLVFPSGRKIVIHPTCSGISENVVMFFSSVE